MHPLWRRPTMPGNQRPGRELCTQDGVHSACAAKFLANLLCVIITNHSSK